MKYWIAFIMFGMLLLTACNSEEPASVSNVSSGERPAAPAPINADFRSDSAAAVGQTGKPQLLEFFTHW